MSLRLGDTAPDFEADTSKGPIRFHDYINGSWAILFSHPDDYRTVMFGVGIGDAPVCTTELSAVSLSAEEFAKRGVKVIGLSANDVDSHHGWIKDIDAFSNGAAHVDFPIIADKSRKVSTLYDMLDHQDATNVDAKGIPFTVRSVFIIDPQQKIRLTLTYPAAVGRNFAEILRVIDALQLGDKYKITTPANWEPAAQTTDPARSRVIVHPSVQGAEVQKLFGDDVEVVYPYLRFTSDPSTKAKAANGTH